jgi:Toprim domain
MSAAHRQQARNRVARDHERSLAVRTPKHSQPINLFTNAEIADLVDDLARHAEAVCRHYLSNGRRAGNHWLVGDTANTPGRSLYVRLKANGKGAAGNWTDAATDEHGDLLDLIRETLRLRTFPEVVAEARRFLGRPHPERRMANAAVGSSHVRTRKVTENSTAPEGLNETPPSSVAARRLFAASQPVAGTLAELYLIRRGITQLVGTDALRFHPRCFHRSLEAEDDGEQRSNLDHATDAARRLDVSLQTLPALIAAITDEAGIITGVQRTYLDSVALTKDGTVDKHLGKALVLSPRRALGDILGHGVRFGFGNSLDRPLSQQRGVHADVLAAGEGVETMLSLRMALPGMPMIAALSAGSLAALRFPPSLRRLYIAQDDDTAGRHATARLTARAEAAGIEAIVLTPVLDDFNSDLRWFGQGVLCDYLRPQLVAEDVERFLAPTR